MEVLHSLIAGLTVLGVIGAITFGAVSCSDKESRLRTECINAGGSVILSGGASHCIVPGAK